MESWVWCWIGCLVFFGYWAVVGRRRRERNRILGSAFWKDAVVILTGASEGIGAELAVELARRGAKLTIVARREALLRQTAEQCRRYCAHFDDVLIVTADVSDGRACQDVVEKTVARFHRLDVVILNAALSQSCLITQHPDPVSVVQKHIQVNLMQGVHFTHFALPHLKRSPKKGIIAPISSMAGLMGTYGCAPYSASKHAIHGYFDSIRPELRGEVDIVIFPLPFIKTKTAVDNLQPKDPNFGMPVEIAAKLIADAIPTRPRLPFLTNDTFVGYFLNTIAPDFMERLAGDFLQKNFNLDFGSS